MMKSDAAERYDKFTALRNAREFQPLTQQVFASYGIRSFRDLSRYLRRNGEYGGAVRLAGSEELVLLPFHNDTLNTWLKFENPRVKQAYELVYAQFGARYPDRQAFERDRFNVEETMLLECWEMPGMDTRILDAPIAGCWDQMEIQARYLENRGYRVKRYCFHGGRIVRGHTFVLYNDGKYWNTCTSFPLHIRRKSLDRLCRLLFHIFRRVPILDKGETTELVEFSSPREGMSAREYVDLIKNGTVVLQRAGKGCNA